MKNMRRMFQRALLRFFCRSPPSRSRRLCSCHLTLFSSRVAGSRWFCRRGWHRYPADFLSLPRCMLFGNQFDERRALAVVLRCALSYAEKTIVFAVATAGAMKNNVRHGSRVGGSRRGLTGLVVWFEWLQQNMVT